jgi:predicted nucleic acid-binding protein
VIFVDTGAWFARFVPSDPDHPAARDWLDRDTKPLLTTDYIVDELLTLLKVRGEYLRALGVGPFF